MSSDRKSLLALLRERQVKTVTAEYSGSGDEGFIDDIIFDGGTIERKVQNQLNDFFWDELCNGRWSGFWDGEPGGSGSFTWDIETDQLAQNHNEYEIITIEHPATIIEADYEEIE